MKKKKARYIYQAIRDGNTILPDIVKYLEDNLKIYISDFNIRYIAILLRDKGYIGTNKIGKHNEWYIIRELSGQIDIKL